MKKVIPFSPLPLNTMKKISRPFIGFGSKITGSRKHLEEELEQADIDTELEEYGSIIAFTFVFYLVLIGFLASLLFGTIITERYIIQGIVIPQFLLIGIIVGFVMAFLVMVQMLAYPKISVRKKIRAIEINLVYALQSMLVQIKSGVTLFDALNMVAISGRYGQLSKEVKVAVDKMNTGVSEEIALEEMAADNPSPYLRKVVWQVVNGMRAGADVSDVLSESVSSITREQEIEIQRYGSSLRVLSLVYLMIGVIIPALGLTLLIVLGAFPRIELTEALFWLLLGVMVVAQFMYIGVIKSKRPNLMGA